MNIVLGVSVTATTVHMVLVEGETADGVTIESDAFDAGTAEGLPKPSLPEQVSAAILATQQSSLSSGHHLVVSGVTWVDHPETAPLRDSMAARGLDNVVLLSEQSAAGALAQTVGRALGYDTTAVMLFRAGTATLSIVDSADGSIVESRTCSLDGADPADVLPELVMSLKASEPRPQGVFVVGSGIDFRSVKAGLENLLSQTVIVPEEPEFALARGAALAAATVPGLEAPTRGLAYSQDPDPAVEGRRVKLSDAATEAALVECDSDDHGPDTADTPRGRRLLVPIGSLVAGVFVVSVVALVMSLAVSIRPTVDQGSPPEEIATVPTASIPTPVAQAPLAAARSPVAPQAQPAPITLPDVASVAQPPGGIPALSPGVSAGSPVQPAPPRAVSAPVPAAVEKPLAAVQAAVGPLPAQPAPPVPAPVAAPPPPAALPAPASPPPAVRAPVQSALPALSPFGPPSLWIPAQPPQQAAQAPPGRQWTQIPWGPRQQAFGPAFGPALGPAFGPALGPQQQALAPPWGPQQQAFDPQEQALAPQRQAFGPQQQALGPQEQALGPQEQALGPQQQALGPQRQALGPQQQAEPPPQQVGPGPRISLWPQRQMPPARQWTPPVSPQVPQDQVTPPAMPQAPPSGPAEVWPRAPQRRSAPQLPWQQLPSDTAGSGSYGGSYGPSGPGSARSGESGSPPVQGRGAATPPWWSLR